MEGMLHNALKMAIARRSPAAGLLHHSDRGVQYACDDYQHLLQSHEMQVSMSGKGDCRDNAPMESFWSTLKTKLVHHERYATRAQARQSIFEYIEVFYNRKRLHSSLGYQSSETFEASLNESPAGVSTVRGEAQFHFGSSLLRSIGGSGVEPSPT